MIDDPISKYLLAVYPKTSALADGTSVTVRTLIPQDRAEVGAFFERVPEEDRTFLKEDLLNREEVEIWLDEIDVDRETVMVAQAGKRIIGTAVLERQRNAARGGRARIETGLRNAIARAQLPPDLDTARAASVVQAFLGGVLRDWLLDRGSIALPRDAEYLADACIGMLRHSQSLRMSALQVSCASPPYVAGSNGKRGVTNPRRNGGQQTE